MSDTSSSGSSGLDDDTARLLGEAPLEARVGEWLEHAVGGGLPAEVRAFFEERGASVRGQTKLKTSFHSTWLIDLEPALAHAGDSFGKVIVQFIGSHLGDKAVCGGHISTGVMVKAMELAGAAGVRVPAVIGAGECITPVGSLEFIVQEFVRTHTVEDRVSAPGEQWHRIARQVRAALSSFDLSTVDTTPMPRFDTLADYLASLASKVPAADGDLARSIVRYSESEEPRAPAPVAPSLLHQDVNDGNLLCSDRGGGVWELDALIDWESAAVGDPRLLGSGEPWNTARNFGLVVKGSQVAELFVRRQLPRCELAELVENYGAAAKALESRGILPFETWAERVERIRAAMLVPA